MTSIEPTRNMAAPMLPLTDLALMDPRSLSTHIAQINAAHDAARRAYEDACENLGTLLTEQITRHLATTHPGAYTLRTRYAADFHTDDETGELLPECTGHAFRLVPAEILDATGMPLAAVDLLSPVVYWLERLTPLMQPTDAILDLTTRAWTYPAEDDCPDTHEYCGDETV